MTREQQAVEGLRRPRHVAVDFSEANRSAFVECVATADFAEGLRRSTPPVFVGA